MFAENKERTSLTLSPFIISIKKLTHRFNILLWNLEILKETIISMNYQI